MLLSRFKTIHLKRLYLFHQNFTNWSGWFKGLRFQTRNRFATSTIDLLVSWVVETKSERIGGNHHVKNIQHLCLDMKKEVYLPKGAVVYLRALSTCLARIYRDSLASMGWKNALRKQYNGKDASGKQILEELKRGKNKRIKRLFQKKHGYVIDEELVGRVMLTIERWNNVLHPEDGTREYTDLDLEKGMRAVLDFLAAVDEVHSISSRLPIEII